MILICPNCATRYKLPAGAVGPEGRTVRCKSCGNRWHATPDSLADVAALALPPAEMAPHADTAVPAAPESPAPLPPPLAERSIGAGERVVGAVSWLLLALLVLLVAALYLGRSQVVETFPAFAPFYERIGLRVALNSGLELRNLTSERVTENERPVLVVTGEIRNTAGQERVLPRVRVALLDESRAELEFGLFDARERALAPGASTGFEARLLDPPEAARTYSVTLADGP